MTPDLLRPLWELAFGLSIALNVFLVLVICGLLVWLAVLWDKLEDRA